MGFKVLDDREHILKRPGMYVGSIKKVKSQDFLIQDEKMKWIEFEYVPALAKIINEIIDNSVDEAIRTNFSHANKIEVIIDDKFVEVIDNGRGISIEKESSTDEWIPVLAWTRAKSGVNFDDGDRKTIGANGVGSYATNVLSKKFVGFTCDGKKAMKIVCENNAKNVFYEFEKASKRGTRVYFEPDFSIFEGIDKIDDLHKTIIYSRLVNLSISYPLISFYYNGKPVKFKSFKEYAGLFSDEIESLDSDNLKIAVFPSHDEDFRYVHYINGIHLTDGGNPLNWVVSKIVDGLKEKLEKKYHNIRSADIKNKLSFLVYFYGMSDLKFDSQSKTRCINAYSDFKELIAEVDFDHFIGKIYKNEHIINPIIEIYKIKEEYKNRKELLSISNSKNKKIEKFFPSSERKTYLVLAEGDSAASGIMQVLGRKEFAYFPLKGKPLNCYEVSMAKIIQNEEIKNIINILEMDLTGESTRIAYDSVLFATDNDFDGIGIRALLIAFFSRFGKNLFLEKKIKILRTPLITAIKNGKIVDYFFNIDEYRKFAKETVDDKIRYKYYKGLGSWEKDELKELFDRDGLEKFIVDLRYDKNSDEVIRNWMSKDCVDERKKFLKGKSFEINLI